MERNTEKKQIDTEMEIQRGGEIKRQKDIDREKMRQKDSVREIKRYKGSVRKIER